MSGREEEREGKGRADRETALGERAEGEMPVGEMLGRLGWRWLAMEMMAAVLAVSMRAADSEPMGPVSRRMGAGVIRELRGTGVLQTGLTE